LASTVLSSLTGGGVGVVVGATVSVESILVSVKSVLVSLGAIRSRVFGFSVCADKLNANSKPTIKLKLNFCKNFTAFIFLISVSIKRLSDSKFQIQDSGLILNFESGILKLELPAAFAE
jgi:hypothetical protein